MVFPVISSIGIRQELRPTTIVCFLILKSHDKVILSYLR